MRAQRVGRLASGFLLMAACFGASPPVLPRPPSLRNLFRSRVPAVDTGREAELEARVRQLEAKVAVLSRQIDRLPARPHRPATAAGVPPPPAMPAPRTDVPAPIPSLPLTATFGPGFALKTADGEYECQFHNLTQLDGRFFEQGGQDPVRDTFTIPRQWFMFSGRLTKPYEYFVSFAHGFETVDSSTPS